MNELEKRVAVVTGASSGIGQAIAIAYARAGAKVVIADIALASQTLEMISALGGDAIATLCDVSSEQSVTEMRQVAIKEYGDIDVLVNNAAIFPFSPIESMSVDVWDRILSTNAKGTFLCCASMVPGMRRKGRGKIINISSSSFFSGLANASAYVASKGAIIGFSRSLARELGQLNIQVNVITPGLTMTPGVLNAGLTEEFIAPLVQQQCIQRAEQPSDLVGAAVFLASDASDFITGQILNVDGGLFAH